MSRSYRKHFWFPTEGDKRNKKFFNRRIRHQNEISSGGDYRRYGNSYDIHSWWIYYPNEEAFVQENIRYGATEQEARKIWRIHYRAK